MSVVNGKRLQVIIICQTFFVGHEILVNVHERRHRPISHDLLLDLCDIRPRRQVNERCLRNKDKNKQKTTKILSCVKHYIILIFFLHLK